MKAVDTKLSGLCVKRDGEWRGWNCFVPAGHLVKSSVQVHRANRWDLKGVLAASRRLTGALVNWELGGEGE